MSELTVPALDATPAEAPQAPQPTAAELAAAAEESAKQRQDLITGITLAVFAAVLAVCDLGGGKYGDDEILAANEKAAAYSWFQSKSVKQTLTEGQGDLLSTLLKAGAIEAGKVPAIQGEVATLEKKADKYSKEKTEILLGSEKVGKENWIQDVEGELGKVVGAKQWEDKANKLGAVGDVFDNGTLFLQMCLVLGAIGIVIQAINLKRAFFASMLVLGLVGGWFTWMAYNQAWAIV